MLRSAALLLLTAGVFVPCGRATAGDASPIAQLAATTDPLQQKAICEALLARARRDRLPAVSDSLVCFLFSGDARHVAIAMDLNRWNPATDRMHNVPGTSLFFRVLACNPKARFEYKLVVDSVWTLDPLNALQVMGGFGPNSEIRMPRYIPPPDIVALPGLPRGRLDTLTVRSRILGRSHPVTVYTPARYAEMRQELPMVVVTDGGEYLRLARMDVVMDNCIAQGRIRPVIGVFVDPMTDPTNPATSTRMTDYALSRKFLRFLVEEVKPHVAARYRTARNARNTAILGASLGGLTATFAALERPDVFGLSAAQSPAYWYLGDSLFTIARQAGNVRARFYIDAGTLEPAPAKAREMRDLLRETGNEVRYGEYPEGHNWGNWSARLDDILEFFWGKR